MFSASFKCVSGKTHTFMLSTDCTVNEAVELLKRKLGNEGIFLIFAKGKKLKGAAKLIVYYDTDDPFLLFLLKPKSLKKVDDLNNFSNIVKKTREFICINEKKTPCIKDVYSQSVKSIEHSPKNPANFENLVLSLTSMGYSREDSIIALYKNKYNRTDAVNELLSLNGRCIFIAKNYKSYPSPLTPFISNDSLDDPFILQENQWIESENIDPYPYTKGSVGTIKKLFKSTSLTAKNSLHNIEPFHPLITHHSMPSIAPQKKVNLSIPLKDGGVFPSKEEIHIDVDVLLNADLRYMTPADVDRYVSVIQDKTGKKFDVRPINETLRDMINRMRNDDIQAMERIKEKTGKNIMELTFPRMPDPMNLIIVKYFPLKERLHKISELFRGVDMRGFVILSILCTSVKQKIVAAMEFEDSEELDRVEKQIDVIGFYAEASKE